MVDTVDIMPAAPTRSGGISQAQFVLTTDAWWAAFGTFGPQFNAAIVAFNADRELIAEWKMIAEDAADRAEAASGFRVSLAAPTWSDLQAVAGTYHGQTAAVPASDTGDHVDPVSGATVDNAGRYYWHGDEEAWGWLDDGTSGAVAWGDITGKPATFTPSPHTHAIGDITDLATTLAGKLDTTAAAELVRDTIGAALVAGDGVTITVDDAANTITIEAEGGGGSVPAAGIAVSTGSNWGPSLTVPTGSLVGTTATQTMLNKTHGSGTVYALGNATGITLQAGCVVDDTGTIVSNSPGRRGAPVRSISSGALIAADNGGIVSATGTVTYDKDDLPSGFCCVIYNRNSSSSINITCSDGTQYFEGSSNTTVSLAARRKAALSRPGTEFVIEGGGISP